MITQLSPVNWITSQFKSDRKPKNRVQPLHDPSPSSTLPASMIWAVLIICGLPGLLNILGVDFGTPATVFDPKSSIVLSSTALADTIHHSLAGSYVHTILEWSAVCSAIFTVILAFAHFKIKHDVTTPILGIALLCAGLMDAFHTLAADRLIEAAADNHNLIPFTWALCRLFNVLISIVGVSLFLGTNITRRWQQGSIVVTVISSCFVLIAYFTIYICANSQHLPQTTFPAAILTMKASVIKLPSESKSSYTLWIVK